MNNVDNKEPREIRSHSKQQPHWEIVLDLGVVIARHKSSMNKAYIRPDSKFLSMP